MVLSVYVGEGEGEARCGAARHGTVRALRRAGAVAAAAPLQLSALSALAAQCPLSPVPRHHLRDLPALVVAAYERDAVWVAHLQGRQEAAVMDRQLRGRQQRQQ